MYIIRLLNNIKYIFFFLKFINAPVQIAPVVFLLKRKYIKYFTYIKNYFFFLLIRFKLSQTIATIAFTYICIIFILYLYIYFILIISSI